MLTSVDALASGNVGRGELAWCVLERSVGKSKSSAGALIVVNVPKVLWAGGGPAWYTE